jgi:hypothetical protein
MEVFYGFIIHSSTSLHEIEKILKPIINNRCEFYINTIGADHEKGRYCITFIPNSGKEYNPASVSGYLAEFRVKLRESLHQKEKEEQDNA